MDIKRKNIPPKIITGSERSFEDWHPACAAGRQHPVSPGLLRRRGQTVLGRRQIKEQACHRD